MEDFDLSTEALLIEVKKAIIAVTIGGQEYRLGNRYVKKADLGMLNKLKNDLMAEQSANNSCSGIMENTYAAVFDRR